MNFYAVMIILYICIYADIYLKIKHLYKFSQEKATLPDLFQNIKECDFIALKSHEVKLVNYFSK